VVTGDSGVIERERAGKKSVARDAMSIGAMRRGKHRRYAQK
jgi:hypothetical protein